MFAEQFGRRSVRWRNGRGRGGGSLVENAKLRQARERLPSPTRPGEPMSLAEAAAIVSSVLYGAQAAHSSFTGNYLGKVERGVIGTPGPEYRAALRTAYGVASDDELGFTETAKRRRPVSPNSRGTANPGGDRVKPSPINQEARDPVQSALDPVARARLTSPSAANVDATSVASAGDLGRAATETVQLRRSRRLVPPFDRAVSDHLLGPLAEQSLGFPYGVQPGDVTLDAMKRRSLISWAAAAAAFGGISVGVGPLGSLLGTETARHGLLLALADNRANAGVDEWNEIVIDYGYDYLTTPPVELLQRLIADVLGIQLALPHANSDAEQKELARVGAMLAVFAAKTISNTGDLYEARRWWRSARRVADESGDLATILWVRGQEIVRALYDQRDIDIIVTLITQTEDHASRATVEMLPEFVSGKAQALAVVGRTNDARTALEQLERIQNQLPDDVSTVRGRESNLKWSVNRYLFTASYVHTRSGALEEADSVQQQALKLYQPDSVRRPTQIHLHRSLCAVKSGDVRGGLTHAQTALAALPPAQLVRPIADAAQEILDSVPFGQRRQAPATEFADFLVNQFGS